MDKKVEDLKKLGATSFHQLLEKYFNINNDYNLISTDQLNITQAVNILEHTAEFPCFDLFFSTLSHN